MLTTQSPKSASEDRESMLPAAFEVHALTKLREEGMRITTPRIEVVRALAASDRALTIYGIHEAVLGRGRRIDVVSVYRIVAALRRLGLVAHVGMVDGYVPRRFAEAPGLHTAMLVDPESRRVSEIDCGPELSASLEDRFGRSGRVEELRIEIAVSNGAKSRD